MLSKKFSFSATNFLVNTIRVGKLTPLKLTDKAVERRGVSREVRDKPDAM